MNLALRGVIPLGAGDDPAAAPVDIFIEGDRIAGIAPAAEPRPARRLLAMPALANAHDHARPLSPTSFGGAGKPLETWLMRLGAMPSIDPYTGALAAFARAARGGVGSVMAHYTRAHGPMPLIDEAREIARAAADVGVRVTLAMFMRDRNPLVYGPSEQVLDKLSADARGIVAAQFGQPMPSIEEQVARVEAIAAAVESPMFTVQFGPNGPQWCSDELLGAIARASARSGRRVHMHLLETIYQRAYADAQYPEGVVTRLKALGLLSERLTLAHCVHARPDELDLIAASGAIIATNPSSNLHLRSGVAPIGEAIRRGCRVAIGVDASAFDEDDDAVREMRLGHFLHGGWGFNSVIERAPWLSATIANGRAANGAPAMEALQVGAPADILVLDLDRLDRDAIMPVAPIDLLFARATRAHIDALFVGGRQIIDEGRLITVDLDSAESRLREQYRAGMAGRAAYLGAWGALEGAAREFYLGLAGCC